MRRALLLSRQGWMVVPAGEGGYVAHRPSTTIASRMTTASPFDDFRDLLANLPPADTAAGWLPCRSRQEPEIGGF